MEIREVGLSEYWVSMPMEEKKNDLQIEREGFNKESKAVGARKLFTIICNSRKANIKRKSSLDRNTKKTSIIWF